VISMERFLIGTVLFWGIAQSTAFAYSNFPHPAMKPVASLLVGLVAGFLISRERKPS